MAAALGMTFALEQADQVNRYGSTKAELLDIIGHITRHAFTAWMKGKE